MITYKELLKQYKIISEEQFNELINSLPDFDLENGIAVIDVDDLTSIQAITEFILTNCILDKFRFVYAVVISFDNKELELCDVQSLEDLEEIKNLLNKWTISNYNDIKQELLEEEQNDNYNEKLDLFKSIINDISVEQVKQIVNDYKR
jgi:hypothetical protein